MTNVDEYGIRLRIDGPIARVTLDRPEQHNALEAVDIADFKSAIDEVESLAAVRTLIVTGSGASTFCSGASLGQMKSGEMSGEIFETLTDRLSSIRIPTICALNGSVYGGGAEIALSCDFRIGVEGSRLAVPAARLGLSYPPGGLERYVQRLGVGTTSRILLAAEELDAEEMLRTGFLTHLVPPDALHETADVFANRLACLAPLAVRTMKEIIHTIAAGTMDRDEANRLIAICANSEDLEEGLRAHDEGRPPDFRGR